MARRVGEPPLANDDPFDDRRSPHHVRSRPQMTSPNGLPHWLQVREQLGAERKRRADAETAITELHSEYGVKMKELNVTVDEAREAALEYLRQLKLAQREGGDVRDQYDELQARWSEMTDEERIGREARRLLESQERTEHEATEARLQRLLAEQRKQLLHEAASMRGDLEQQVKELKAALQQASAPPKKKASAPPKEPHESDKEGKGKLDFTSNMNIRAEDFFAADADGTNDLGLDEFAKMWTAKCARDGAPPPSEAEVREIFDKLDQDKSGSVDLSEYVQWALRDALDSSRGRVLDLFREWDADNSGSIDKKEFGAALKALGFPCGKGDLNKIFADLDPGGDGKLEYNELNASLRRAHVRKTEALAGGAGAAKSATPPPPPPPAADPKPKTAPAKGKAKR